MSRLTRQYLRIPRVKTLFGLINLQTSTELISLALAFNKVTGVYGLLAILTGYQLSLLQLSTYIYSILILVCLVYLLPHIRRQSPLECLGLAWLYLADTLVNGAYAAAFGMMWYLANTHRGSSTVMAATTSTDGTVVEGVETVDGLRRQRSEQGNVMPQETATSMLLIMSLTLVRLYFSLVIMSFARQTLQKYMQRVDSEDNSEGPFAVGLPYGEGRRGRLGRLMVSIGRDYWLDGSDASISAGKGWTDGQGGTLAGEV